MASGSTEGLLVQDGSNERPLFMDVNADEELETTEIESLCMQCRETVSQFCVALSAIIGYVYRVPRD